MHKIQLLILLLLIAGASHGQIRENTIFLGGGAFYFGESNQFEHFSDDYKGGDYSIAVGKAIKENTVAGLTMAFRHITAQNVVRGYDTVSFTYNWYVPGVFLRGYRKIAKDFYFFGQLGGDIIIAKLQEEHAIIQNNLNFKQSGGSVSLSPGLSYQVFKCMQVELSIPNLLIVQYVVTKYDSEDPQYNRRKEKQFLINSALNGMTTGSPILGGLGVGFRFML